MDEPGFGSQRFRIEDRAGWDGHRRAPNNKPGRGTPGPGFGASPAF
jgi:hypothetical protein